MQCDTILALKGYPLYDYIGLIVDEWLFWFPPRGSNPPFIFYVIILAAVSHNIPNQPWDNCCKCSYIEQIAMMVYVRNTLVLDYAIAVMIL